MADADPVRSVRTESDLRTILSDGKPAVLDVYADWCGPCKRMKPLFAELARRHGGAVHFLKLDCDGEEGESDLAQTLGATVLPTFLAFERGSMEPAQRIKGADGDAVTAMVERLAAAARPAARVAIAVPKPAAPAPSLSAEQLAKIDQFRGIMSTDKNRAYHFLNSSGWDVSAALDALLTAGDVDVPEVFPPEGGPHGAPTLGRQSSAERARTAPAIWTGAVEDVAEEKLTDGPMVALQFRCGPARANRKLPASAPVSRLFGVAASLLPEGTPFALAVSKYPKTHPLDRSVTEAISTCLGGSKRGLIVVTTPTGATFASFKPTAKKAATAAPAAPAPPATSAGRGGAFGGGGPPGGPFGGGGLPTLPGAPRFGDPPGGGGRAPGIGRGGGGSSSGCRPRVGGNIAKPTFQNG